MQVPEEQLLYEEQEAAGLEAGKEASGSSEWPNTGSVTSSVHMSHC